MKRKKLLALAMLAGISMGSFAENHYLVKDGAFVEGVSQLDPGEDDFLSEGKSPAGDAAILLTHVKKWSDARLYTEKDVNLATHSKLVIEYYFDKLSLENYPAKYPAITVGFGTDTIGGLFTRDAAAHTVTGIDVKFKHIGKEGQLVKDTAFIYCRPDKLEGNKFFTISYDRDIEPNDNVLYIKNIYLLDEKAPFFAENFEANAPTYQDEENAERYVISNGEVSLQADYSNGFAGDILALKNSFFKSGFALSSIDPDGKAFEEGTFGITYNSLFNAPLRRRWEPFGSDVNTGTLDDADQPVYTDPITVAPGAFYDTEIYHSLSVSKNVATVNGSFGFLNIPLNEVAEENSSLKVSFLAKWSAIKDEDLTAEADKTFPVFIKFDNGDKVKVSEEDMTGTWTIYEGDVAIPSGVKSFDIIFSPNTNYSYNIDNLQIALDKQPYTFTIGKGEGIDAGDDVVTGVTTEPFSHVASIASDDANASAYFDGDNFIVKADEEIASISIIDMAGKTASVNGGEFNVSGFNKGIYVFVAKTVNGVSISGKIIIE